MELEGRSALITGASRGLGAALAGALAGAGMRLALSSRGGPALDRVADATDGVALPADLARPEEVGRLADAARERLGGVPDVLVNNAGVFHLAPAASLDPALFDLHLAVNLSAPFRLVRACLPAMLERDEGRLVHVGSQAGRIALPGNAAYSASKYGLRGLHEVLEVELEGTGVRTLLVEPGPIDTEAWDSLEDRLGEDLPERDAMLDAADVAARIVEALVADRGGVLPVPADEG